MVDDVDTSFAADGFDEDAHDAGVCGCCDGGGVVLVDVKRLEFDLVLVEEVLQVRDVFGCECAWDKVGLEAEQGFKGLALGVIP